MLPDRFRFLNDAPLPAWMAAALAEYGTREVSGAKSNPRILGYRKLAGLPIGGDDSDVPWCAIFVNAMLAQAKVKTSGSAMARSFVKHANFERLDQPVLGCIAVKSSNRGAASGHVGFYVAEDGLMTWLLGGNQNDEANISAFRKREFVGFFWPKGVAKPSAPWNAPIRLARPKLPHERTDAKEA